MEIGDRQIDVHQGNRANGGTLGNLGGVGSKDDPFGGEGHGSLHTDLFHG